MNNPVITVLMSAYNAEKYLREAIESILNQTFKDFETGYAQPLWQALRAGKISQLQVDILGGDRARRLLLNRADAWAFWRRSRPLAGCSLV